PQKARYSASATARLRLSGALRSLGEDQQSVSIAVNSEGHAKFELVAPPAIGVGKITVDVNGLGEHFTDETEIGIRPSAPLQKTTGSGAIDGGSTQSVS